MSHRDGPGFAQFSGATRTGKTSLVKALIRQRRIASHHRVVFFDPKAEYGAYAETVELRDVGKALDDKEGPRIIRVVPSDTNREAHECGILAQWCHHHGNTLLCVDEAHDAASSGRQGLAPCSPKLIKLVKRGAANQCGVWCISQRPSDIHASIRAELNSQETWFLRLVEAPDLEVVRKRGGRKLGPVLEERVSHLPTLTALRLRPLSYEVEEWKIEHEKDGPHAYRSDY